MQPFQVRIFDYSSVWAAAVLSVRAKGEAMMHANNPMSVTGRFKLGTFASNCSSGMSVTKLSER